MLDAHWGVDPVQRKFYMRQGAYRATMQKVLEGGGAALIAENLYSFKLSNTVKTLEDLTNLVQGRIFIPTLREGGFVLPQVVGINSHEQTGHVVMYAPLLKAFHGKVAGLLDAVLRIMTGKYAPDLIGLISGTRNGSMGALGIISAHSVNERESLRRTFAWRDGAMIEFNIPQDQYEKVFGETFDSDIFVDQAVWDDQSAPK